MSFKPNRETFNTFFGLPGCPSPMSIPRVNLCSRYQDKRWICMRAVVRVKFHNVTFILCILVDRLLWMAYLTMTPIESPVFSLLLRPVSLGSWPGGAWVPWWAAPVLFVVVSCLLDGDSVFDKFSQASFHRSHLQNGFRPNQMDMYNYHRVFTQTRLTDRALTNRQLEQKKSPQN